MSFVEKCWVCKGTLGHGHLVPIRLAHTDGGTEDLYRHGTCPDYSAEDRAFFLDRANKSIQVGAGGFGHYTPPGENYDGVIGPGEIVK